MAILTVTTSDLESFLDLPFGTINSSRAQMMLDLATAQAGIYLSPLSDTAKGVVLSVAARGYSNAQGIAAETVGPYSVQRPAAGIYLSKAERASLKALGGRGGAFSIDPTPIDAGTGLAPWDLNVLYPDGVPLVDDFNAGGL